MNKKEFDKSIKKINKEFNAVIKRIKAKKVDFKLSKTK